MGPPPSRLGRRELAKVALMNAPRTPFSDDDFARFTVAPDVPVAEALRLIDANGEGVVVVIDDDNMPIGIVTKGQLAVALRVTRRIREVAAHQCMSKEFATIQKDAIVDEAEALLRQQNLKFLVVVDDEGAFAGLYRREEP